MNVKPVLMFKERLKKEMDDIAKLVQEFKQEIREKVIAEFVEAITNEVKEYEGEDKSYTFVSLSMIERIAERLKGGNK